MSENQKLREALQAISHIDDTTNHSVDASAALDRIGQIARQALALPTAATEQSGKRCQSCGYLTTEREHLGCLRKAMQDLDAATGGPYATDAKMKAKRRMFEESSVMKGSLFKRRSDNTDEYWDGNVQDDWELWQECASLSATDASASVSGLTAAPVCEREAFEREMSKPPFEFCMDRWPDDGSYAWPGNYAAYHTQCAWAAWQACAALSAGDAVDAQRYRWLADCNNYEAGLALIIDPKLTEQALGAAIDAAILVRGEVGPLTRYRVWPDGTVQEGAESPYAWMSDDFEYVDATDEEQAALSAAMRKEKP